MSALACHIALLSEHIGVGVVALVTVLCALPIKLCLRVNCMTDLQ